MGLNGRQRINCFTDFGVRISLKVFKVMHSMQSIQMHSEHEALGEIMKMESLILNPI